MYKELNKLENGRYEYLVECPGCHEDRWIKDLRATHCRSCKKTRALGFCRIWPTRCKHCGVAKVLRFKPKIDGSCTCDYCKGKYGGRKAMPKEEVKKGKIKCSECHKVFNPVRIGHKTCSKLCSEKRRRKRIRDVGAAKRVAIKKKSNSGFVDNAFDQPRMKLGVEPRPEPRPNHVNKDNLELGGLDEYEQPVYIRDRVEHNVNIRKRSEDLSNDEKSAALVKEFLNNGGQVTIIENTSTVVDGQTYSSKES